MKSQDERIEEVKSLSNVVNEIYDADAQKEGHKLMAETLLGPVISSETMDKIKQAIDDNENWFDLNATRATAVQQDVVAGLSSKQGAADRRWLAEDEIDKLQEEATSVAEKLSGGENTPIPPDQPSPGDLNASANSADVLPKVQPDNAPPGSTSRTDNPGALPGAIQVP